MWGYLGEFWNAITGIGDYTIQWFQNIGNAVAGAVGSLFEDLIHHIYDIFYVIWWFLDSLKDLFSILLLPLTWAFNFGKGFFDTAFKTASELGLTIGPVASFKSSVMDFFNAIPHFNLIFVGVGSIIGIIFLVFIIKKLASI